MLIMLSVKTLFVLERIVKLSEFVSNPFVFVNKTKYVQNSVLFSTRSIIFGSYGDITINVEVLQMLGLCSAPRAFKLGWISYAVRPKGRPNLLDFYDKQELPSTYSGHAESPKEHKSAMKVQEVFKRVKMYFAFLRMQNN